MGDAWPGRAWRATSPPGTGGRTAGRSSTPPAPTTARPTWWPPPAGSAPHRTLCAAGPGRTSSGPWLRRASRWTGSRRSTTATRGRCSTSSAACTGRASSGCAPCGVPPPFPDTPGQVINDWVEGMPASMYCTAWAAGQAGEPAGAADELWRAERDIELVYFLGFDNAYFWGVTHLALLLAHEGR